MTTGEYFKLTEDAGNYYRSGKYEEALSCCSSIINDIESIKKQMPDFNELNKDFILYSVFILFAIGVNDTIKIILNKILSSNIISKTRLKEDIDHCFEFEGYKDFENAKKLLII